VNYLFEISTSTVKNMTRGATFFGPETAKQYGGSLNPITSAAIEARRNRGESLRAGDLQTAKKYKTAEKHLASGADPEYKYLPTKSPISYRTSTGERGQYSSRGKDVTNMSQGTIDAYARMSPRA